MLCLQPVSTFASATDLLHALRERQISSVELLELHLQRIKEANPALNAIVTLDEDNARHAAKEADAARARGIDTPLLGLPVTIKDTIDVRGLPTTAGVPARANAIATTDSGLAACIRNAGAIILGKTNIPLYAADWQTNNPLFGRCVNPWDRTYTPGGSTGGGAAALAGGLTSLEFGSDIGGSIRIPAAFCGIYGHKPSEIGIPSSGNLPIPLFPNTAAPITQQGPLGRSAIDLERAFQALRWPKSRGKSASWQISLPPPRHQILADYRVAVLPALPWLPVDREILDAQEQFITRLGQVGVRVKVTQPQGFGDLRQYYKLYLSIVSAISSKDVPLHTRLLHAASASITRDEFSHSRARGLLASAANYISWFAQREVYRAAYRAFFHEWDILLSPANFVNAFLHTDLPFRKRVLDVDGTQIPYLLQNVYASLASLCGLPSTAFPVSLTHTGLPIGFQATGPYLEDRTTMRFTALVEAEFGGFHRPPNIGSPPLS